jgi:hypothetical protein
VRPLTVRKIAPKSAGKLLSPGFGKVQGNQEKSAARAVLASDRTCMLLTPCFFLSSLSFSQFNLSRFDEPTPAAVTMTESHTRVACHPERSEGSVSMGAQILRCAQDDRGWKRSGCDRKDLWWDTLLYAILEHEVRE